MDAVTKFRMTHDFDLDLWEDAAKAKIKAMGESAREALGIRPPGNYAATPAEMAGYANQAWGTYNGYTSGQYANALAQLFGMMGMANHGRCQCCGRCYC